MAIESAQNTSGRALVDHWNYAAEKGLMKRTSANALRAACTQILSALDGWETVDITRLDVDDAFHRFQNKRARDFKPESLEAYRRRFAQAVKLFKEYVRDPKSWKPTNRKITPSAKGKEQSRVGSTEGKSSTSAVINVLPLPQVGHMDYPFQLSEGRVAMLRLPVDLKLSEVQRLVSYMTTVAIDFNPEKGPRP